LPTLIGILDLVRPPGTIVDFKTSAQTPEITRLMHQTEIQLTCYSVLYREATGDEETGFELHHLVKQKVPKLIVTALSKASQKQQDRLFRVIESYVQGVDRQDFVPSIGLHCASCEYFSECRRWS
jgi:CRISPR/Cas system-associated exonuclease Cas4 (RecB family)